MIQNLTFVKKIIGIEEFDKFRILRNQIAHSGARIKYLSLKEEIANISEYVGKFIFNDLDKTEFKLKSQKELMYNHFPKFFQFSLIYSFYISSSIPIY